MPGKVRWMRFVGIAMVAMTAVLLVTDESHARGRRAARRGYSNGGSVQMYPESALTYGIEDGLQAIAQARADAMAAMGLMSHDIHAYTSAPTWAVNGVEGEGIGCGDNENCETCIVGRTVIADARARGRTGMVYRVRFFRH